jgi:hypothetical protein
MLSKDRSNNSIEYKQTNPILQEYMKNKSLWKILKDFINLKIIYDGSVEGEPGLDQGMSNIAISRFGSTITQGGMYINPKTEGFDSDNLYILSLLNSTGYTADAKEIYSRLKSQTVEDFIKQHEAKKIAYLPVSTKVQPNNQLKETILNNYPELYPEWQQRISDTFGKRNLAELSRAIHKREPQIITEILLLLEHFGYSEEKSISMIQKLQNILPNSEVIGNSLNKENTENCLIEMCQKALEIAKNTFSGSVFIKNDSAAGFGVIPFAIKELEEIVVSSQPLETYLKYVKEKVKSKSPNFENPLKLLEHSTKVFFDWSNLAIQEGLDIQMENSFQVINGEPIIITENLVDSSTQQHYGNIINLQKRPSLELVETIKILNLLMYLKFESRNFAETGILEAIQNLEHVGYFGWDGILTKEGAIKLIEANMRTTGNTPGLTFELEKIFKNLSIPPEKFLTRSIPMPNFGIKDLEVLARKLNLWLQDCMTGVQLDSIDIYAMESLEVEAGDTPLIQVNIKKLPGETDIEFEIRCKKSVELLQNLDERKITINTKNHHQIYFSGV